MFMKHLIIWMSLALLLCTAACEKNLPVFGDDESLLNFYYGHSVTTAEVTDAMRTGSHSFKLNSAEEQLTDTIWLTVNTMGKLSTNDRPLALQQITVEEASNAVAGIHYVAFDDAALASLYTIPARQMDARIPIIVKRDPSLVKTGDVILKITFKENDYFKTGYPEFSTYMLTISDRLSKPTAWDKAQLDYYFGTYGPQKHELMIKWTQEIWDNTYIESLFYDRFGNGSLYPKDSNYINYLDIWFAQKLEQENQDRLKNELNIWKEADGTPVDFTPME